MTNKITDQAYLENLFRSYATNSISESEYARLMDLIAEAKRDDELYAFMEKVWNSGELAEPFTEIQSAVLFKRILEDQRVAGDKRRNELPHAQTSERKSTFFSSRYIRGMAAGLIILFSAGLLFYKLKERGQTVAQIAYTAQDIKPGGDKALLVLANGEKINLADTLYRVQEQSADTTGQLVYNSISTPAGGQYRVLLPDGTRVWLNASSSLHFPVSFRSLKTRPVRLEGEAYFEVAHNKAQPFLVDAGEQQLEVLGTHFNIDAYANEPAIRTTLLEGAVLIKHHHAQDLRETRLKPGQQSALNAQKISVSEVDPDLALAWKKGYFSYKDEALPSIMRKLERWYDVEIVCDEELKDVHFEGTISRFKNVSEILRKFELTGLVHFKIEGRRITAMP